MKTKKLQDIFHPKNKSTTDPTIKSNILEQLANSQGY